MEVEEGRRKGEGGKGRLAGSRRRCPLSGGMGSPREGGRGEGKRGSSSEAIAVALLSVGMGVVEGGRDDGRGTHGSGGAGPRVAREGVAASVSVWSGLSDVMQVDEDKTRGASGEARATSGGEEARRAPNI